MLERLRGRSRGFSAWIPSMVRGRYSFDPSWWQTLTRAAVFASIGGVQALLSLPGGGLNIVINVMASAVEIEIAGKIIDDAFEANAQQTKNTQTNTAALRSSGKSSTGSTRPVIITQEGFHDLSTGITSFNATAVPESSTLILLGSGLAGILYRRQKLFKKS